MPFEYGEYTALVSEMYWGEFSRKIILPTDVDYTKIEAKSDDGMLIVRIPKFSDNMEQKISITEIE
ncbi:MAG: Hsp20/alpha crystallin family protein [Patescibacteria group bacterium]|nr:Hsp20/alpha crystallin family protein [Patescibacteria group bacterium]